MVKYIVYVLICIAWLWYPEIVWTISVDTHEFLPHGYLQLRGADDAVMIGDYFLLLCHLPCLIIGLWCQWQYSKKKLKIKAVLFGLLAGALLYILLIAPSRAYVIRFLNIEGIDVNHFIGFCYFLLPVSVFTFIYLAKNYERA